MVMANNRRLAWMMGALVAATVVAYFVITGKGTLIDNVSFIGFWPIVRGGMEKYTIIDTSGMNRSEGWKLLNDLTAGGKLDFRQVSRHPVTDEWLTPEERDILQDEPVQNPDSVAAPEQSRLVLVSPSQNSKITVGDNITVRVDLKDAGGRRVQKGGHFVRVWMVQDQGRHHRALAADVMDMHNGSFVATLPVLWNGNVEVRAALVRSREFRRVMLSLKSTVKTTSQITSAFVSGKTEQVTLCGFVPVVPGFPAVCNLTAANGGLPWYCGQPNKTGLNCGHWAWSSHTDFPSRYPVSETGNLLIQRCGRGSNRTQLGLLPQNLTLTFVKGQIPTAAAGRGCEPLHPRDSWTDQSPRGFWEDKEWHPLIGCPLPLFDATRAAKCLQHTRLIFLGDSNAHQVLEALGRVMNCTTRPDPRRSYHPNMLHVPVLSDCPQSHTSLAWYPHAYPFFSGRNRSSDVRGKHAPSAILDKVPSSGKHVVLIHLYMHFSPLHISIYAVHVRDTARAVRDLLARNPEVKVFIRGPHGVLCGKGFRQQSADMFTEQSIRVLKHEFAHLRDHVTFLNMWDMTVANVNFEIHPDGSVLATLIRMMLSRLCPNLSHGKP